MKSRKSAAAKGTLSLQSNATVRSYPPVPTALRIARSRLTGWTTHSDCVALCRNPVQPEHSRKVKREHPNREHQAESGPAPRCKMSGPMLKPDAMNASPANVSPKHMAESSLVAACDEARARVKWSTPNTDQTDRQSICNGLSARHQPCFDLRPATRQGERERKRRNEIFPIFVAFFGTSRTSVKAKNSPPKMQRSRSPRSSKQKSEAAQYPDCAEQIGHPRNRRQPWYDRDHRYCAPRARLDIASADDGFDPQGDDGSRENAPAQTSHCFN